MSPALWFGSLSLSVSIFSLFYGLRYGQDSFVFVFRITMLFALSVACLYLPFVLTFSEKGRLWAIIGNGALIGPACLAHISRARRSTRRAFPADAATVMGMHMTVASTKAALIIRTGRQRLIRLRPHHRSREAGKNFRRSRRFVGI